MARVDSFLRRSGSLAAVAGASLLAGCTMCPDPYDYSGPVPNGSVTQNDFRARSKGIVPIGAAPRPWPPLVRKDGKPAADGSGSAAVRVASEQDGADADVPLPR
jgi:hypothetical protein